MSIKILQKDGKFKYKCSFCNKVYDTPDLADSCRDSHDLVYLQILRSDIDRILKFLYLKDESLITETLIQSLRQGLAQKNEKN